MTKSPTKKKTPDKPKPRMEWQVEEYDRFARYEFVLPYQFLLLCRLVDTEPRDILNEFMTNLGHGTWDREGRDDAKAHLREYFISHGYGKKRYTEQEIRKIFQEMDAVGLLFPHGENSKMIDLFCKWREAHHKSWFKKWFRKKKQKLNTQPDSED